MYPGAEPSQLRADLALMRLFRHLGVPVDVPLPVDEIRRHWTTFGVRSGDLPGAIERLLGRGLLTQRQDAPDQVACTVAGSNWLDEQPAWLEYHLLLPRISRARYAHETGARGFNGTRRRRSGDSVARRGSA